jgi:PAS domain S-box-containing protein
MNKKTFISLAIVFTCACAFLFNIFYQEAKNTAITKLNEEQMIHAKQAARGIDDFFATWTRSLSSLSRMDEIIDNDAAGKRYMKLFYEANQEQIRSITRLDERGVILYNFPINSSVGTDISTQKHIREMLREHKPVISDAFRAVEGFDAVALHVPIFRGSEFKGTIGILINFQSIAKRYLDVIKIGETGYAWVVSRDGTQLYSPIQEFTGKSVFENIKDSPSLTVMVNDMLKGHEGAAIYFDRPGDPNVGQLRKYAVYMPIHIGNTFWSIAVTSAEQDVLSGLISFRNKLVFVIGALFICGMVFSILGIRAWFIVKEEEKRRQIEEKLLETKQSADKFLNYTLALLAAVAAFLLYQIVTRLTGHSLPIFTTFYPAIMLVALAGGLGPGLFATFIAVLLANYFILSPQDEFGIANSTDAIGLALFSGMGVLMSVVAERYRRLRNGLEDMVADRTTQLKRTTEQLQQEIEARNQAQESLRSLNEELEQRIAGQVSEIRRANETLEQRIAARTEELQAVNETLRTSRLAALNLMEDAIEACRQEEQARETLRRSEERYRSFVEASAQIVWTTNDAGEVVMDIPSWQAYTGQSADEARGLGWMNAIHPDDRGRVAEAWRKASESRSLYEVEYLLRKHDGTWRNVLARGVPVLEADGSVREYVGTCTDITDKKQAEQALRQAGFKYRTVADNTYDWELWLDLEDRFIYCSPSCERVTGYSAEDFIRDPGLYRSIVHPDDRGIIDTHSKEDEQRHKPSEAQWRIVHADGSIRWISHVCQPVYLESGEYLGVRGSNRDFTVRKKSEDALLESEQYRSAVFSASPTGIFITRLSDGVFLDVNDAFLQIFRYPVNEVIGKTVPGLNIWVNADERERVIHTLREHGTIENSEATFRRKNGDTVDLLYSVLPLDRGGEQCVLGTVTDISALKQIELLLQQQRKELQIILDSVQAMVFYKDTENRFVRTNRAFEDAMGADKKELENRSLFEIYPAEVAEAYWRDDKEVMSSGRAKRGIIEPMPTTGGTRLLQTDKIPYIDESGRVIGVIGCCIDITEQKKAEEELTQSNRDLEQFAYVASHDLQEPLRIVTSYVQLLEKRYKGRLDTTADEFIAYTVDAAKRMRDLINDLLDYSRVGTQGKTFERTDCNAAIDRAVKNLELTIKDSGAVVTHGPLPTVLAGDQQFIQLFQNLINNAIKFRGQEKPRVTVSAEKNASDWLFMVKDNGIGIAPEFLERIFIIFQRLHGRDKYPGTGIGLAICRRIVEHHGGRIWAESEPGKGAQFYFTIPER